MGARTCALLTCVAMVACGGAVLEPDPAEDPTSGTAGAPDSPSELPPSSPSEPAPPASPAPSPEPTPSKPASRDPACDRPLGRRVFHTSVEEVRTAIQGRWILCSDKGLTHEAHDGIEFVDKRWHLLLRDAAGVMQPVLGAATEGGLEVIDTSSMNGPHHFQINYEYDRGGTVYGQSIFTANPEAFTVDNNAVHTYRYVRAASAGP